MAYLDEKFTIVHLPAKEPLKPNKTDPAFRACVLRSGGVSVGGICYKEEGAEKSRHYVIDEMRLNKDTDSRKEISIDEIYTALLHGVKCKALEEKVNIEANVPAASISIYENAGFSVKAADFEETIGDGLTKMVYDCRKADRLYELTGRFFTPKLMHVQYKNLTRLQSCLVTEENIKEPKTAKDGLQQALFPARELSDPCIGLNSHLLENLEHF